jgi:hypothetical protein
MRDNFRFSASTDLVKPATGADYHDMPADYRHTAFFFLSLSFLLL